MLFTANQLAQVCAATVPDAERYVEHLNNAMEHFMVSRTRQRMAMFCAQVSQESQRLTRVEENLNYTSIRRLRAVWPNRFTSDEVAAPYVKNPQKLANMVYANRMGNGSVGSGDGWNYRGRGLKQLTGQRNYTLAEAALGMRITGDNAGRVAQPLGAAYTACWFWASNGCNEIADAGDFKHVTQVINGGLIGYEDGNDTGLDDRVELYDYAASQLDMLFPDVPA